MSTYYGFQQIDLHALTYEDFRKHALDLPRSLSPQYGEIYDGVESMSSPYATGLGAQNQGHNFMPQIYRELKALDEGEEKQLLLKKIKGFYTKVGSREKIHPKLINDFKNWYSFTFSL